jgi:hypothetical protein
MTRFETIACRAPRALLAVALVLLLGACQEKMVPAGVTGYNHTKDRYLYNFTVNGAMGSNLSPESGGGKESCCVSIPATWRPGLKAVIEWEYDTKQGDPNPPPPSQRREVEIPKYARAGKLWVHFYENEQVKIVVSICSIEHPFYPMSKQDKLPWESSYSKQDAIDSHSKGGAPIDC